MAKKTDTTLSESIEALEKFRTKKVTKKPPEKKALATKSTIVTSHDPLDLKEMRKLKEKVDALYASAAQYHIRLTREIKNSSEVKIRLRTIPEDTVINIKLNGMEMELPSTNELTVFHGVVGFGSHSIDVTIFTPDGTEITGRKEFLINEKRFLDISVALVNNKVTFNGV